MMMEIERSAAATAAATAVVSIGMGMGMGMDQIERKSSIESEPRTLNIHQVDFARKAALFVLNTTTFEQASNIFTQGLEPMSIVSKHADMMCSGEDEDEHYAKQRRNQFTGFRDVVSAPF